jgi:hypothetical protein
MADFPADRLRTHVTTKKYRENVSTFGNFRQLPAICSHFVEGL